MLKIQSDKIIIDGHEPTKDQCETMTLLANALAESNKFKTIEYRNGYAEFEKVGKVDELRFVGEITPATNWTVHFYLNGILRGYVTKQIGKETTSSEDNVSINGSIATVNLKADEVATFEYDYGVPLNSATLVYNSGYCVYAISNKISVDLTTLSGWEGLSDGNHKITIVAKADGYRDSLPSEAVSVTKESGGGDNEELAAIEEIFSTNEPLAQQITNLCGSTDFIEEATGIPAEYLNDYKFVLAAQETGGVTITLQSSKIGVDSNGFVMYRDTNNTWQCVRYRILSVSVGGVATISFVLPNNSVYVLISSIDE